MNNNEITCEQLMKCLKSVSEIRVRNREQFHFIRPVEIPDTDIRIHFAYNDEGASEWWVEYLSRSSFIPAECTDNGIFANVNPNMNVASFLRWEKILHEYGLDMDDLFTYLNKLIIQEI